MKICVGLSGGVDSSVAALILKNLGHDVFAMFMQNWHDADSTLHGDCEWEEDRFIAEMVARKIGIPFYFVDLSRVYRKKVVDYMFDEYSKGRTPNPDVLCNREIKFDAFWNEARKLGADMVATGHYCIKEIVTDETGKPVKDKDGNPVYKILAGKDKNKDQSYFLCQLSQKQLSTALFPIGNMDKSEVRRMAAEAGLPSADKKDSQGICFVGKVDLPVFLQQKLEPKKGRIVEVYPEYLLNNSHYAEIAGILRKISMNKDEVRLITSYISDDKTETESGTRHLDTEKIKNLTKNELEIFSEPVTYDLLFETETYRSGKHHVKKIRYKENPFGKIVGEHDGAHFYTIGQRKGLNVGGHADSLFVISTDVANNVVYVGEGHSHPGLSRSCLKINSENIHWIRPDKKLAEGEIGRFSVRIRYRQPLQSAILIMKESDIYILFENPQRGITPGQFAVWYDGEEMSGSGVI